MSLMFCLYLLTFFGFVWTGLAAFLYNSAGKLNRLYLILCLDLALWALVMALMNLTADADYAAMFRRISAIFWSLAYALILHFFICQTGRAAWRQRRLAQVLIYVPALVSFSLYVAFSPLTAENLVRLPIGWAYAQSTGFGLLYDHFLTVYYVSYIVLSLVLLISWGRTSRFRRDKRQMRIVVISLLISLVLGTISDIILPMLGNSLIPPLAINIMFIASLGIWLAIRRYRTLALTPMNLAASVLDTMHEGMIIADQHGHIQRVNTYAAEMLGFSVQELKGQLMSSITPNPIATTADQPHFRSEMVFRSKDGRQIPVLISISCLMDEFNENFGTVVIFQDITNMKLIQSELEKSYLEVENKVRERTRFLHMANDELKNEIAARIEMENQVSKMAFLDPLTGLANRRLFREKLIQKIDESRRNNLPFAVIFVDLDAFKIINDTLGHVHGDELLKLVASRLSGRLRITDTIGRVGGDEFLIIVHNTPDEEACSRIGEKLVNAFHEPFRLSDQNVYMTASLGISLYPVDGEDADTLIKNADIAMYRAKDLGKNKFEICNSDLKSSQAGVMKLQNDLHGVLERGELELFYQPQVNSGTNSIEGFEALLRWNHPERGMIGPAEFIPLAERTGLIVPIGDWVLKAACMQNKAWQDQGLARVPMAVNLSIKQLLDNDVAGRVMRALEETGLAPEYLDLEITESVLMQDTELVNSSLDKLKKIGVRISIDDFGTEYSSLHYLKKLPVDRIKIAMTFIHGIAINRKDEAIINAIIALAENLDIDIIAEGVETQAQMEYLRRSNCEDIQGFFFYRPMPARSIEAILGDPSKVPAINLISSQLRFET